MSNDYRKAGTCAIIYVVKLHEAAQMFVMVDYVTKMTSKMSCKHGKYGLFEHLLFLLYYFFQVVVWAVIYFHSSTFGLSVCFVCVFDSATVFTADAMEAILALIKAQVVQKVHLMFMQYIQNTK